MSSCEKFVKQQHAIWKLILHEFEGSAKEIQLSAYEMVNKWLLSEYISEQKKNKSTTILELPSDKQLKFAKDLGIDPTNLSKQELSKKIDEKRGKQ